ncbi:MAG: glycosyltransferase [Lentisphaerae bacterium]|nr:glycosyltransferase [Lentisphaerota bacterium]
MTKIDERWQLTREKIGAGRLSVVMPVFNLAATVAQNLTAAGEVFERHGVRVELVPVDDGSSDGTGAAIMEFAESGPFAHSAYIMVNPVICPVNRGKGAALRAGFEASTGEYVLLLDGDLDIHPKQTPFFFESMAVNGTDIVVGSKRHRRSIVQYPWFRRALSWIYFTIVRLTIGMPITDTQTGMKLFKREVLGEALDRMLVKNYAFDLELLSIAWQRGAKISEAPVRIKFGSKFGALKPSTIWSMAKDSLAIFYRLKLLRYYAKAEVPPKQRRKPSVSVVIACPGPSWMLEECLDGLSRQTYENFEVIVLPDDGVPRREGVVRWIPTGKVRPAEKRNAGIAAAYGEIVAFIDDDAYPEPNWIECAVKYFADPTIGAVGGPGVTPPGDGYFARLGGRVYENIFVSGNYRYRYISGGVMRDVDDYPSCNLFVRRALLQTIGSYRTDFWPGEDTLLCKDIVDMGRRIVYDPWMIVNHHRRPLFLPHLRQLGRYAFHRGYFVKRFPSNSLHLSYFIPSAFALYMVAVAIMHAVLYFVPQAAACPLYAKIVAFGSIPALLYAALTLVATFSVNPATWLLTWMGVYMTHMEYGFRFLQGLCAKRAPCEFIGQDHAIGNVRR